MREERVIDGSRLERTINERWNTETRSGHWYEASTQFSLNGLGNGQGRSCLVIGSPIFEAKALKAAGWDVTYLDVRRPPFVPFKFVQCDAMEITFPDESFDAVSTACVLTHVGTGRYGDGVNEEHGDEIALRHIARVLKKGCYAAITFGACADSVKMVRLAAHRIYNIAECERMLQMVGLDVLYQKIWSFKFKDWLPSGTSPTKDLDNPDYISFFVRKPEDVVALHS